MKSAGTTGLENAWILCSPRPMNSESQIASYMDFGNVLVARERGDSRARPVVETAESGRLEIKSLAVDETGDPTA